MAANLSRRGFLRGAAGAATAAVALGRTGWQQALAAPARPGAGYGPLLAPDANGVLLPEGFTSRVVARTGEPVGRRGHRWHYEPDGGAVFPMDDGGWVYASNSEVTPGDGYAQAFGGAGAVRFDPDGEIVDAYPILTGSQLDLISNNCAGGATPWGTWLSCEEQGPIGRVFECTVDGPGQGVARPLMGLFSHEAAAVDPRDHRVYMTEDAGGDDLPERLSWGRFYRYTPLGPAGSLLALGTLDALVVDGDPYDGTTGPWPIHWSLPVEPLTATVASRLVGATPFDGGEGCWYDDGAVYFTTKGDNRVWHLDLDAATLEVLYDDDHLGGPDRATLTGVDNVTVSPGKEVFVAEDGGNLELVLLQPPAGGDGPWEVSPFLRLAGHEGSEITGPAFTPDGTRLYFSSQRGLDGPAKPDRRGVTFEITGPFAGASSAAVPDGSPTGAPTAPDPAVPDLPHATGPARLPATGHDVPLTTAAALAAAGLATAALARRSGLTSRPGAGQPQSTPGGGSPVA